MARERLIITLSPELALTVADYADAIGKPRATAVTDLLEITAMHMKATASALRIARERPLEAYTTILAQTMDQLAQGAQRLSTEVSEAMEETRAKSARPKSNPKSKPATRSKRSKSA